MALEPIKIKKDMDSNIDDDYPYESHALKQTHPLHLYTLGKLFGLNPTTPQQAHVLELACANGQNLIPMAFYEKNATFIGIDIASKQIAQGQSMIAALNLNNIFLKSQSILDFKMQEKFDYIICHGLFSWVDDEVRNKVLQLCHDNLQPQGIAYISYNTYPGWVIGDTLRDMLLYQSNHLSPLEKFAHVQRLLKNLSSLEANSPYTWLLQQEAKLISTHSETQLMHEHLSKYHYPLYFNQFIEKITHYQLEYLTDATFFEKESAIALLQNQDFLQNRRFRSSLICHKDARQKIIHSLHQIQNAYEKLSPHILAEKDIILNETPVACALVQYQASQQDIVTNNYHENIYLTPLAQALIPFLDGKHNIFMLNQIIKQWVEMGILSLVDNNQQPITKPEEIEQQIVMLCQTTLKLLTQRSLIR
ncbi:MAG: methyltransferase domain-containing protein [Proteobacteria bacterium]|nr:methyltransferase domain-containing protein [Pseudomonadota bacterium]